jgi:hypothetical protein
VRKIRQSFPKRRELLATRFEPLSDDSFRQLVSERLAIPGQIGSSLFVAKWRDGPGMEAEAFLAALRAQGASLEVRRFKADVNIRVVRSEPTGAGTPRRPTTSRRTPP